VALPPGLARLVTRPSLTGSSPTAKTIGIAAVAALAATEVTVPGVAMTCHLSADQISQQSWQTIVLALPPVVLDSDVLAFDVTGFLEAFAERGHITRVGFGRPVSDKRDHRHRRLLRGRCERPRGC